MLANHNVWSSSRSWVHRFPMLIGTLRLPDANGKDLVCGNQHHLSIADLKDFAVKLWSEFKILLSEHCFAAAWTPWSRWALTLLPLCCLFAKKNFDGRNVINQANSMRTISVYWAFEAWICCSLLKFSWIMLDFLRILKIYRLLECNHLVIMSDNPAAILW